MKNTQKRREVTLNLSGTPEERKARANANLAEYIRQQYAREASQTAFQRKFEEFARNCHQLKYASCADLLRSLHYKLMSLIKRLMHPTT